MVCMLQGIYKKPKEATISTFIPGSAIMEWFSHQSMGNIVKAQVTPWKQNVIIQMPNHSCNKWMGMAACAVFSPLDLYPKNYSLLTMFRFHHITFGYSIFALNILMRMREQY